MKHFRNTNFYVQVSKRCTATVEGLYWLATGG